MKKQYILWVLIVLAVFLFAGCGKNAQLSEMGRWKMEFLTDKEGAPLAVRPGEETESLPALEMSCELDGDGAFLIETENGESWSGQYTKERLKDSIALSFQLEDGTLFSGVCGMRYYADETKEVFLMLDTEAYIISLLKEN